MTNAEKLKEIERLWILSKITYVESRWLIDQVKALTDALEHAKARHDVDCAFVMDALNDTGDRPVEKEQK